MGNPMERPSGISNLSSFVLCEVCVTAVRRKGLKVTGCSTRVSDEVCECVSEGVAASSCWRATDTSVEDEDEEEDE